jgi:DNA invertase Pin-like site-specific DNA recombinase
MIAAAIYARKSNDQNGVAVDAKSVTRQIEHATAYAATKGWTVDAAHVYTYDAISGAEFQRRPGFLRLMNALKPRPAFTVLVMMDEDRLGREQIETAWALKQLITAGSGVLVLAGSRADRSYAAFARPGTRPSAQPDKEEEMEWPRLRRCRSGN